MLDVTRQLNGISMNITREYRNNFVLRAAKPSFSALRFSTDRFSELERTRSLTNQVLLPLSTADNVGPTR